MDLETIEPALLTWAAALTGVPTAACLWENAPRVQHGGQLVLLSWVSTTSKGTDQVRWEYDPAAPTSETDFTPEVCGQRVAALQVSIESHDQRPGHTSRHIAERARTRMSQPSAVATLRGLNLGLADVGDAVVADYQVDGRWVSRSIVEVRLNAVSRVVDTAGAAPRIDTVGLTATITTPAGTALPASLQPSGSTTA